MSIEVPISQLSDDVDRHPFGYLITVGDDRRSHVVALRPMVLTGADAPVLRFTTGSRRASTNVGRHPDVTIVFPPLDEGGMSLIVDGTADAAPGHIDVTPARAVLHRAAPPIDELDDR